ncbi:MAG: threonine--tRNA ligase [Candidatus Goldiibacteriota bacterium]
MKIKYNGAEFEEEKGIKAFEFIKKQDPDKKNVIAVSVNGKMKEPGAVIEDDAELKAYTFEDAEGRDVFWHSTSHIMAAAVKRIYPEVKVAIGPAIEEGFYYDFDKESAFSDNDLEKIEKEMLKIIKENHKFERMEMSKGEAVEFFKDAGETYKVEILNDIAEPQVSLYKTENFVDLCRGPHIGLAKKIKAVKLTKVAGAYWRGDEKNKMLQRIYGISFPEKGMLEEYLKRQEEAKERDHRKIGREMDLFSTHEETGPGLIYWHPKGGMIRKEMEDFWRNEHLNNGYDILYTPHVAKIDLWETSGHTGFYRENMFNTMEMDNSDYQLKPMNCPFHILIYKNTMKSYKELPLRWCELGTVYRYEKSGVLHGLMRVRGFTQDDAHIFCMDSQLEREVLSAIDFVMFILKTFGFEKFEVYLSTRPDKYVGEPAMWERAEGALKNALENSGLEYQIDPGEGVFYGPKIDIKIKDALNRTWQCSTIQVDFNLPERFDVNYIGSDGKEHRAVMIHRALMGSLERFFGVLIEHYKGAFPVWLAPYQAAVLTITERSDEYARKIVEMLKKNGIRTVLDDESEKIGAKIRKAALQKVPYMIIIGDKEVETNTISVRKRGGEEQKGAVPEEFTEIIKEKIKTKDLGI